MRLNLGISRQTTLVVLLSILLINLFLWHLAATVGLHSAVGGIYYICFLPAILIDGILRFLLRRPNETGTLVEICVIQYLLLSAFTFGVLAIRKALRSRRTGPLDSNRMNER